MTTTHAQNHVPDNHMCIQRSPTYTTLHKHLISTFPCSVCQFVLTSPSKTIRRHFDWLIVSWVGVLKEPVNFKYDLCIQFAIHLRVHISKLLSLRRSCGYPSYHKASLVINHHQCVHCKSNLRRSTWDTKEGGTCSRFHMLKRSGATPTTPLEVGSQLPPLLST